MLPDPQCRRLGQGLHDRPLGASSRWTATPRSTGSTIIGVFHSHTHTDAYPSPTDVAQAPDPGWHYVLVSLRDSQPVVRSYAIVEGTITEESVVVLTHAAQAS